MPLHLLYRGVMSKKPAKEKSSEKWKPVERYYSEELKAWVNVYPKAWAAKDDFKDII